MTSEGTSRRWARLAGAALAAALGAAVLRGPAAAAPAPDPCASVPRATADPATDDAYGSPRADRLWAIPPAGSCRIEGGGTARTIALRYPDGRLWATWTIAPLEGGLTAYFPGGRQVRIVEETYPAPPLPAPEPARLRTASGDGRVIAPSSRSVDAGPGCRASRRLKVAPREALVLRLESRPILVRLRQRPGRARKLAPRELLRWRVAAPVRVGRWHTVDLDVVAADGRVTHYAVCLTREPEPAPEPESR
jgi:hypothetical protein